jgi:hypothetical protein
LHLHFLVNWHASCDIEHIIGKAKAASREGRRSQFRVGGTLMSKTKKILVVGAVIAAGFVCGQANAEDPSRAFIDRVAGAPFRAEGAVASTKIETNPAQAYIDRVSGAEQLVAAGPGTTSITTDTSRAFIDRVAGGR